MLFIFFLFLYCTLYSYFLLMHNIGLNVVHGLDGDEDAGTTSPRLMPLRYIR